MKSVIVETDHQPLVTILKKTLRKVPMRLQKMLLSLQHYDIKLVYKQGKEMYIADMLSRACLEDDDLNLGEDDYEVMCISPKSTSRWNQLKESTAQDQKMQQLIKVIRNGWPRNENNVHTDLWQYFNV